MPLFFYLPLIVWSGMVEIMLDTTHDPDGQNDQRDPANPMMDTASIIRFPRRLRLLEPSIVAAPMNRHHPAQGADRKLLFIRLDESVPHMDSLAKYAVAFFRMSRSSVTRFNSALRRLISAW